MSPPLFGNALEMLWKKLENPQGTTEHQAGAVNITIVLTLHELSTLRKRNEE
jgi:hypothetical protein